MAFFFVLAGITEHFVSSNDSFLKRIKSLLFPWLFFSLFSILYFSIRNSVSLAELHKWILGLMRGCSRIEENFCNVTLWFLTCLLIVRVFFYFIKKLPRIFIAIVCLLIWVLSQSVSIPTSAWNIDQVFVYFNFYGLGFFAYYIIDRVSKSSEFKKKIIITFFLMVSFVYTVKLYYGNELISTCIYKVLAMIVMKAPASMDVFAVVVGSNYFESLIWIVSVCIVSVFIILLSKVCENVIFFQEIGRETLWLCGIEAIVKDVLITISSMMNIDIDYGVNPIAMLIFAILSLVIGVKYFIPTMKRCYNCIVKKIEVFYKECHNLKQMN